MASLDMDTEGWVSISQLLSNTQNNARPMCLDELLAVVAADDNDRFKVKGDGLDGFIRCVQGHNKDLIQTMQVQLTLAIKKPPAIIYHGTPEHVLTSVMSQGLLPQKRQYVHMTVDKQRALKVAKRYGVPVLLEIDTEAMALDGYEFKVAENAVWLIESVPPKYLKRVN